MIVRAFGGGEHEPHAAAVEERERGAGGEQKAQAERVAVERGGARHVLADDGDLTDAGAGESGHGRR